MTTTTHPVTLDTVRTDVQDLRKGDVLVYRTHRSTRIYMVDKVGQEDILGKVRITLRKQGEGRPLVFTTSGVSRFDKVV